MKKYFLHDGKEQDGPYSLSDLKSKDIKLETEIWYEDLIDWTPAGQIEELNALFTSAGPPPIKNLKHNQSIPRSKSDTSEIKSKPLTKSWKSVILKTALTCVVIYFVSVFYNRFQDDGSGSQYESYEEKVMSVEEVEQADPAFFLNASGKYNENFWGDKLKIKGKISSTATVAKFKDAVVRVTYYSKSNTVLGSKDYTIYEIFPPNSVKEFELKIDNYKDVNSIGWDVESASVKY